MTRAGRKCLQDEIIIFGNLSRKTQSVIFAKFYLLEVSRQLGPVQPQGKGHKAGPLRIETHGEPWENFLLKTKKKQNKTAKEAAKKGSIKNTYL